MLAGQDWSNHGEKAPLWALRKVLEVGHSPTVSMCLNGSIDHPLFGCASRSTHFDLVTRAHSFTDRTEQPAWQNICNDVGSTLVEEREGEIAAAEDAAHKEAGPTAEMNNVSDVHITHRPPQT
jgi:hypothetical protein